MKAMRAWRYRLYPSKAQEMEMSRYFYECKNLWNSLIEFSKKHYEERGKLPTRQQLYLHAKGTLLFSQVAQNVADRLAKALRGLYARRKAGMKAGFPRFKSIERMKSFTYPQFGFRLGDKLELSGIGAIHIRKHRETQGEIRTLTVKRMPSEKWFAVFTSEMEIAEPSKKHGAAAGIDLGIAHFAYLSDGTVIQNPRHLKVAEERLKETQRTLSKKKKGGANRRKARLKVAVRFEKLTNRRRDFLHKLSRNLANKYSFIAMEDLNTGGMAKGFLAKSILDCGWAEFAGMLAYKAEEAGCDVVLVNPANTTSECSNCGSVQKKSLAERWHECACGASMHRDLNAAINILNRATSGLGGSNACGKEAAAPYKDNGASILHEAGSPGL